MTDAKLETDLSLLNDQFGPAVLQNVDGDALLRLVHERQNTDSKCLIYWLELNEDEELPEKNFRTIGGGSAFMYGVFQTQSDSASLSVPRNT